MSVLDRSTLAPPAKLPKDRAACVRVIAATVSARISVTMSDVLLYALLRLALALSNKSVSAPDVIID